MKRIIDIFLAILFLILFAFPMLVIAVLVRIKLGPPILFSQTRPGRNGKSFRMVKFRTMRVEMGSDGKLMPDTLRLTDFGKFLRSTSLDELPEIWNVLIGQMSFVGPRPLLMEYLPLYTVEQARRHEVRPGITGWAQVNGRNALSWEEKFKLDIWYVENQNILLDIKILLMTILKVFSRDGITAPNDASMPTFKGARSETENE